MRHVVLYLKRTEGYGLLLPHSNFRSKKAEILGQVEDERDEDMLEVFSDSDWAGTRAVQTQAQCELSLPVPQWMPGDELVTTTEVNCIELV